MTENEYNIISVMTSKSTKKKLVKVQKMGESSILGKEIRDDPAKKIEI